MMSEVSTKSQKQSIPTYVPKKGARAADVL